MSQENSSTNRTAWPLHGGSVVYSSSHEWVLAYVNLGLGDAVTGFNVSLLQAFNVTGNGTICFPSIGSEALAPLNITDGQTASIQVVNINAEGNALYNCADIVFRSNATLLSGDACKNSTGVGGYYITNSAAASSNSSNSSAAFSSAAEASSTGAASDLRVGVSALVGGAVIAMGILMA